MIKGTVIKSTGSWYDVFTADGRMVKCRLRGQLRLRGIRTTNPVAVGDRVEIVFEEGRSTALITAIEDRHNFIIRKATNLSKASHIIAANLDQALLVATLMLPRTSTGFIDRFLVTAEAYHIPAVIAFNKLDLYDDETMQQLEKLQNAYEKIGYKVLRVSALTGFGLDALTQLLKNKTTLISGHSGVGKSALVNAIDPALNLRTANISDAHNKGKHTTTFAEMFRLAQGGMIVDTPGIKEFGLHDFEFETLSHRFPEMRALLQKCHFSNCTHLHEPYCAIKMALEKGEIAPFRYANYLNMLNNDFSSDN